MMEALPLLVLLIVVISQAGVMWLMSGKIGRLDAEVEQANFIAGFAVTSLKAHLDGYDVKILTDLDMPRRTGPIEE